MKKTRVLLISFLSRLGNHGLSYISSSLEDNSYPVKTLTVITEKLSLRGIFNIIGFIGYWKPHLIGMSLMSPDFLKAQELTKAIKRHFQEIPVIWGGIHPTISPFDSINYADIVCVGEGEEAMIELADRIDNKEDYFSIRNLYLKKNGEIIQNQLRPYIRDLDSVPFPTYNFKSWHIITADDNIKNVDNKIFRKYADYNGTSFMIMTTRGCPYNCSYCCNHVIKSIYKNISDTNHIRRRSVDNVIEELQYIKHKFDFLKIFVFSDDSFLLLRNDGWLEDFCKKYKEKIKIPFFCKTIPGYITEKTIGLLKDAGLEQIQIGLQANERINMQIFNRNQTNKAFLDAARILEKFNLVRYYDVILKNPYMSEQDIKETIEILFKLKKPFIINYYPLTFFKGTKLYEMALNDGFINRSLDPYKWDKFYPHIKYHYKFYQIILSLIPYFPARLLKLFLKHPNNKINILAIRLLSIFCQNCIIKIYNLIKRHPNIYFNIIKPILCGISKPKRHCFKKTNGDLLKC